MNYWDVFKTKQVNFKGKWIRWEEINKQNEKAYGYEKGHEKINNSLDVGIYEREAKDVHDVISLTKDISVKEANNKTQIKMAVLMYNSRGEAITIKMAEAVEGLFNSQD